LRNPSILFLLDLDRFDILIFESYCLLISNDVNIWSRFDLYLMIWLVNEAIAFDGLRIAIDLDFPIFHLETWGHLRVCRVNYAVSALRRIVVVHQRRGVIENP